MNIATLRENWDVLRAKLRQKFPVLRDEELELNPDREEDGLLDRIARRTNQSREAIVQFIQAEIGEMGRAGNVPRTMRENAERLGNPGDVGNVASAPSASTESNTPR